MNNKPSNGYFMPGALHAFHDTHYLVEVNGIGSVVIEHSVHSGISTRIYPLAEVNVPASEANTTADW